MFCQVSACYHNAKMNRNRLNINSWSLLVTIQEYLENDCGTDFYQLSWNLLSILNNIQLPSSSPAQWRGREKARQRSPNAPVDDKLSLGWFERLIWWSRVKEQVNGRADRIMSSPGSLELRIDIKFIVCRQSGRKKICICWWSSPSAWLWERGVSDRLQVTAVTFSRLMPRTALRVTSNRVITLLLSHHLQPDRHPSCPSTCNNLIQIGALVPSNRNSRLRRVLAVVS